MAFVACCGQLAIATWAARFHLDVQNSLIGTTTCDVQCFVFAVVDGVGHLLFPESKLK